MKYFFIKLWRRKSSSGSLQELGSVRENRGGKRIIRAKMNQKMHRAIAAFALLWMGAACSEESAKLLDAKQSALAAAQAKLAWDATELRAADAKAMAADKALRQKVESAEKRVKADEALGKKDELIRDRKKLEEARADLAKARKADQAALGGLRAAVRDDKDMLAKASSGRVNIEIVKTKKLPERPVSPTPEPVPEASDGAIVGKKPLSGSGR
jgi:hypothetical protein